jgi:hypothetical protein
MTVEMRIKFIENAIQKAAFSIPYYRNYFFI